MTFNHRIREKNFVSIVTRATYLPEVKDYMIFQDRDIHHGTMNMHRRENIQI